MPETSQKTPETIVLNYMEATSAFLEERLGLKLTITVEDKLRASILEACMWLRADAPGKALEILEHTLNNQ